MLLSVEELKTYCYSQDKTIRAVDGATFSIKKGEILSLVGESGCGKTLTALSITRLMPSRACRITAGQVVFNEQDLLNCKEKELINIRGRDISYIFQEPATALNPVMRVGEQIKEAIVTHRKEKDAFAYTVELLELMGIDRAKERYYAYPHQLSGGMKQRVMIAMAISTSPQLLIADEPTTALDVTVQAQILQLLKKLQKEKDLSMLFITHDLAVASQISDQICVMYAGEIVEKAGIKEFLKSPKHPYSQDLLKCIPKLRAQQERLKSIKGRVEERLADYQYCRYTTRCDFEFARCRKENVQMIDTGENHGVKCFRYYK
ncbi:MAG: ABC transporter ATP-binding protein [Candidatus Omnitrophota bacterium]